MNFFFKVRTGGNRREIEGGSSLFANLVVYCRSKERG